MAILGKKKRERTGCSYTLYIHESQVHSKWKKPDLMLYEYVIAEKRKLESNESWTELRERSTKKYGEFFGMRELYYDYLTIFKFSQNLKNCALKNELFVCNFKK